MKSKIDSESELKIEEDFVDEAADDIWVWEAINWHGVGIHAV